MSGKLWTPGAGEAPMIAIPGKAVRHVCDFCDAKFLATDDRHADDLKFIRHHEACWKQHGEDATGERIEAEQNEPLNEVDQEQINYLRQRSQDDPTLKGSEAWKRGHRRIKRMQQRMRRR